VAEGTASLPALGYALSIAKNAASGALGYAVAEALGPSSYEITAFSQIGKLYLTANNKLLRNAGVFDLFKYVEQGGRGKSSEYISNALVKKTGAGFFQVTEGEQVGRTIDVADLQKLGTKRWPVSNVRFELTELKSYATARIALSTFWRDFGWNAGIAIAIETPFFVGNVLPDPYLTPQQKGLQAGITLFGIGGTVYATTAVGQALGNVPGAVAGFVVGLGYEYFLVPIIIRPAIYQFTGVDPYDRTRRLAPLHSQ
jgi:hypothetical protein